MNKFTLLAALVSFFSTQAQVTAYYSNVNTSLTGANLYYELADKVEETHDTFLSYTPGVWTALQEADMNPSATGAILLIYGYNDFDSDITNDRSRGLFDNGGATGDWNREHVYPKSLGNPNLGNSGPGSDAHHIRPADVNYNASRSNRKFADGSGNSGITSQGYWYPGDEWKGDVARMILYMYIRYGSQCLPSAVGVGSTASTDSSMLNIFLEWNAEDPVSDFEDQRNDAIEDAQGNRNPFIDNPAFATSIWGGVQAENRFGTGGGTTTENAGELFISEYVEGTSFNKAIEIANFTGASVNLSNYSLKKQTNGWGAWSSAYNLSGTLGNGQVIVIANSNAGNTLPANITTTSTVFTFNGNDPVGLFKNNTLIDIVGTFYGGSANFGANQTLVRKPDVTDPSTSFATGEWNFYPSNTFSFLGNHSAGSSKALIVEDLTVIPQVSVYPNPAAEFITTSGIQPESAYTIYTLNGEVIQSGTIKNAVIDIKSLITGVYHLTFTTTENQLITRRVVKK